MHDDMCVFGTNCINVPYKVVLQGIMHVCNFFFNDNVYKMILLLCIFPHGSVTFWI